MHTGKKSASGNFIDKKGNVLGLHKGISHYTIGQRKGLGISDPEPLYVIDICPKTNTVVLGSDKDLYSDTLYSEDFKFINSDSLSYKFSCKAKIRYRQSEQNATAYIDISVLKLVFDAQQQAITPGQAVVLYNEDAVLGGGKVSKKGDKLR